MILIWILIITVLAAFAFVLCFAATKGMPVENWMADYSYAHRGLHGQDVPENSMRAFELAAEKGYGIELDVHLSADGIPVVIHDDHLKRMTGMDKPVSALDAQSLSGLSLAGSGEGIPLFEEVLRKVNGRVPLLVEIKSRGRAGELEQKTWELAFGHTTACLPYSLFLRIPLDGFTAMRPMFCADSFLPHLEMCRKNCPVIRYLGLNICLLIF